MRQGSKEIAVRAHCLLALLLLTSCASSPVESGGKLTPTQLNAEKTDYHGKRVRVHGWMRSGFENYALWQSEKANSEGNFAEDCVSLLIPESMDTSRYDKRYVEVEGIFLERLPNNVVHLGGCNVTTLKLLEGVLPVLEEAGR